MGQPNCRLPEGCRATPAAEIILLVGLISASFSFREVLSCFSTHKIHKQENVIKLLCCSCQWHIIYKHQNTESINNDVHLFLELYHSVPHKDIATLACDYLQM